MSEKECLIVRDLMPQRIEEICSEESKAMVDEHVSRCPACAQIYGFMRATPPQKADSSEGASFRAGLKQMRKSLVGRSVLYSLLAVVLLALLVYGGSLIYHHFYQDFSQPLDISQYEVKLSQTSKGQLLIEPLFEGQPYAGAWHMHPEGDILYLSYNTSRVKQRRDIAWYPILSDYALIDQKLRAIDAASLRYSELGREVLEIRQGDANDYKVVYKAGDTLPSTSREKEQQLMGGYMEIVWDDNQQSISFPIMPISTQMPSVSNP